MRHSTTQELFSYWNEVRENRLAPLRFDIEPARIAGVLSETMMVEKSATDDYRFRLAGTRLCEQFGSDFRGTSLLDLFSTQEAAVITRNLQVMADQGAVGLFDIHSSTSDGAETLSELILLPLIHGEGVVDRYLGGWSIEPRANLADAGPFNQHSILDYELVWPRGRPPVSGAGQTNQSPVDVNVRYARVVTHERRHFRVYDGGRSGSPD